MIASLNYLVPILCVIFAAVIGYKFKRPLLAFISSVVLIVVWQAIQPSYIPKGTVERAPVVEFEQVDKPMVNRMLMPKTMDEYDAKIKLEYAESEARRQAFLEKVKH